MIDARVLLREGKLSPKKSFGQNFLVDANTVRAIARAAVPDAELERATVVELGAGLGALTSELVPRARRVVAVERDRDLIPLLRSALADAVAGGALVVEEADAQTVDLRAALGAGTDGPRVLCGNLPYQITGRLLQRAVEAASSVERVVFMVQREVADRPAALPSTKDYGALTVFTRAAFDVRRVMTVSSGCFFPPPDITSAVVELVPRRPPRAEETETFRAVVKHAFALRRKTLRNAWAALGKDRVRAAAESAGIELDARGETLDVEAFARMANALDRVTA